MSTASYICSQIEIGMGKNMFKSLLTLAFSIFMLTISVVPAYAQESDPIDTASTPKGNEKLKEGDFDVTETILEHISDGYSWHLWGHTSLPLPVILHTDKGFEVFSSAKLENEATNEPVAFQGNYPYKIVEGKLRVVDAEGKIDETNTSKILNLSITKNVASMLLSMAVLLLVFLSVAGAYKKTGTTSAPKGFQSFVEPVILFIRDKIAKPYMGNRYVAFMPFLLTVFFFILINNLFGLVPFFPGGANLTGNIAFTMTLAVITFIIVNVNGKSYYWKHILWMPGLPVFMKIFLAPIELLGVFTKPVSLMIRLFANMTAGHILVLSLICLIFIFKSVATSVVAVPFAVFINAIELLVAFLQAYIFTMLTALYIGMAIKEDHHH